MKAKTAYSYIRFSTPAQQWGDSERRQEESAKDYCAKHNLTLSEMKFADKGVSGWKGANRKGALGQLLNILEAGDYLLIEDNDRLSRENPLEAMNLLHSIVFKGVSIVTLRDGHTITKANFFELTNFLPSIIKSAVANEETEKKSMRLKEAWHTRRKAMSEGKYVGGVVPFWIKKDAGKFLVIEERAQIVRDLYEMAYKGMGYRTIIHNLSINKVPTYRRSNRWSNGILAYILKSPTVYGCLQPMTRQDDDKYMAVGEEIVNYYPPIITKDKFLAVQAKIAKRVTYGGGKVGDNVSNLFSGIIKCPKCGENIIRTRKGNGTLSYLVCSSYHFYHRCVKAIINYVQVEKSILDYIQKGTSAIKNFTPDNSTDELQQQIEIKTALINNLQKTIVKLTDLVEQSDAPLPILSRLKERIAEQLKLKEEIKALEGQRYMDRNMVTLDAVRARIRKIVARDMFGVKGAVVHFLKRDASGNIVREEDEHPAIFEDRLKVREALRNSVESMTLDLPNKVISVTWKSKATSTIEMTLKRQGQKKSIYYYRATTNGNPVSDWVSIGTIL